MSQEGDSGSSIPVEETLPERLASAAGLLMLVGGPDTGKTTLAAEIIRAATARGRITALVDADVGQSTLGPPATIGMSVFREQPVTIRTRRPEALAFVGSTQPFGYFSEVIAGVIRMVDRAYIADAELVVLDTTGLAPTAAGLRLKEEKIVRLRPAHLLLIERHKELHPLARLGDALSLSKVYRVPVSPLAHLKPDSIRRGFRQQRFAEYFSDARVHRISLQGRAVRGCSLLAGRPLSPQARLRAAEVVRASVTHASLYADRLDLVTARPASVDGLAVLQQRFSRLVVRSHRRDVLNGLLIALEDARGELLDVGIVQACDFSNLEIDVLTPLTHFDPVRVVRVGCLRVRGDGKELGSLRQGEI